MEPEKADQTTDAWPIGRILKHVIFPKPKGSPKAGRKEIALRVTVGLVIGGIALVQLLQFLGGNNALPNFAQKAMPSLMDKALPSCDSPDTQKVVQQLINDLPQVKAVGARFVALKTVSEQAFNKAEELRACGGTLVSTLGEDTLQYSVSWHDKSRKIIAVKAQIVDAKRVEEVADNRAQKAESSIEQQVAADAVQQLEIARKHGSPLEICIQAKLVSTAYLQAKDETNYAQSKVIERQLCRAAGMPE